MSREQYPVHESLEVLDGKTIYRTQKWWLAVLKTRAFGRTAVSVYLWVKRDDAWKRQQKASFRDRETWEKVKKAVDKLL